MKRIILSVFAAAVTAAWVVPASAGDVTFSGQYRVRGEYVNNSDYNDLAQDTSDSLTQRVRLTANAKATDDVSVKVTLQDTRAWGSGLNADSAAGVDTQEAYVNVTNIFGAPVALRAGRQELNYGDQRLIGSVNWSNNGQVFDAFKLSYSTDAVNVDVFSALVTESAVAANNDDTVLHGVYATLKQLVPNNTLDVYLLNLDSGSSITANTYTLGARLKGAVAGVDYTAEVPFQFGDDGAGNDISAWALAVKAGYTIPTPMKIRIGAEYDFATGDDSTTADAEAFNQLYPTNHGHFGIGDVTAAGANTWSDISAWSINASVDLNEKTNLYVAYWDYTEDQVAAGTSDDIGNEIDVVATYKYNNNLSIEAGAARFSPGDNTAVNGDSRDWAYLQITANF